MVTPNAFRNTIINRNGKRGQDACMVMAAAIQAVDPAVCIQKALDSNLNVITIAGEEIDQHEIDRVFVIGFGKAAVPMATAVLDILGDRVSMAKVVTKDPEALEASGYRGKLEVFLGGHPVPDESSVASTQAILQSLPELTARDLVIVVISGGGSALFMDPGDGITLNDMQEMTDLLLRSGTTINEINTLRKHLDTVKGGRLAGRLAPAKVHTLILSDVIGDPLDMIASGPTVPDPTTYADAWIVINKYELEAKLPPAILAFIEDGKNGKRPETFKSTDFAELDVVNHLVGTNMQAALASKVKAQELGYQSLILTTHLAGLTETITEFLSAIIRTEKAYHQPLNPPFCIILGGEATVQVTGDGLGGRNQDLVLRMTRSLADYPDTLFISLATDGEDGPTDAAGGVTDALVLKEGKEKLGLEIDDYIVNQNSHRYLSQLGGLIKIGLTGTNVNDLIFIFGGAPDES